MAWKILVRDFILKPGDSLDGTDEHSGFNMINKSHDPMKVTIETEISDKKVKAYKWVVRNLRSVDKAAFITEDYYRPESIGMMFTPVEIICRLDDEYIFVDENYA